MMKTKINYFAVCLLGLFLIVSQLSAQEVLPFPEQVNAILERGKQFSISRNVCNVHWHSDVVYGRMMGAATVAALYANSDFVIDLEAAKSEIFK